METEFNITVSGDVPVMNRRSANYDDDMLSLMALAVIVSDYLSRPWWFS